MIERTTETERMAIFLLRRDDWSVKAVSGAQKNYNLDLYKFEDRVAAKVVNQRNKVSLGQIEKFLTYLQKKGKEFSGGICISTSGFTRSVYSYLRDEKIKNLKLAILDGSKLYWDPEEVDRAEEKNRPVYIGVFTCKGGVGKTTIAAHLAGALAMNDYEISLVDLDPQRNLQKLLGEHVRVPLNRDGNAPRVSVYDGDQWRSGEAKRTKYVVCDCNPEFEANPVNFIRRFNYCIIPTTLNPLGINKNADVIKRTFEMIRKENSRARLFTLINNFQTEETKRNSLLNGVLKTQFKTFTEDDMRCTYIDPTDVAIRSSKQLLYWGFHMFDQSEPTLGFRSFGKYSHPRMDFLKLVDFLEQQSDISNRRTLAARM